MALYARITSTSTDKLPVHSFCAALREWADGGVTRQQVVDAFALDATDQQEIDAIANEYNAQSNQSKWLYLQKIETVFILCESGHYTEAMAKTRLGF